MNRISRRRFRCLVTILFLHISTLSYSQNESLVVKAASYNQQGQILYSGGRYKDALVYYFKASEILIAQNDINNASIVLFNIGTCYYGLGDNQNASDFFAKAMSLEQMVHGTGTKQYAIDLSYLGLCHYNLGDFSKALECHLQARNIIDKLFGNDSPEYESCMRNIASCDYSLGDFEEALKYYNYALSLAAKYRGTTSPDYATSLIGIGNCYANLGDYSNAFNYFNKVQKTFGTVYYSYYKSTLLSVGGALVNKGSYEKAIECFMFEQLMIEQHFGRETTDYATCLNNIGVCYYYLGDYSKSLEFLLRTVDLRGHILSKEHPDYVSSLNSIAFCYRSLGNSSAALNFFQQTLSLIGKIQGKNTLEYATCLNNIGVCYSELGDYDTSLDYYQQSLVIRTGILGESHLEVANSLNNIGTCYYQLGDYTSALEYHHSAFKVRESVLGREHSDCAVSLQNIGGCYLNLNDYSNALDYYRQALAIFEKGCGSCHSDYSSALRGAGQCLLRLGEYSSALDYYLKALAVSESAHGKEHPDYAYCLGAIGRYYFYLQNYEKALEYYQQSLLIKEILYGKENPDYISGLHAIAACYTFMFDKIKSIEYTQQALSIQERCFGENHPSYTDNLLSIALSYSINGNIVKAADVFNLFYENSSSSISKSFSSLTELKRSLLWNSYSFAYADFINMLAASAPSPDFKKTAYNCALFSKGLLLNTEIEIRKLILESGDKDALKMYNDIQESRVNLDRLYKNPVGKKGAIDSLNNDIEIRQQELMKRSKVYGDYTRNLALKWTDVQAALGKKSIAIEFESYTQQDTTFYIALTLRPGYTEPHLVELFNSEELKQIKPTSYYTSTGLTKLVWGNLNEELDGVENIFFSPVGELYNIGIEYLLDEDSDHLISEKRNYFRLTSTRELAKDFPVKSITDATIYGGIRYDLSPSSNLTGKETESERLARTATRSRMPMNSLSVTRSGWVYLPGTKEEAEAISSTLSSKKVRNDLLEGENGTEESFKALSGAKKDVIHIATHGFYWTETEAARSGMAISSFMLDGESQAPKEDKALTRSGLLFAGAQNAFEGKDIPIDVEDGILTAKDISRMDLRGTDLVVISACQSGLGEVTGDGVFGLQRGFKKAGVQSIVMSLWEVSDEATKIMMTRFYENLAKGKSKYDAFREAQRYLRKYDGGLFDEPEYYAAFVLLDAIK